MSTLLQDRDSDLLTDKMKIAQQAIELPEIQLIAQTLAKYNLGIFMPHMHDSESGKFVELPHDMVSREDSQQVSFVASDEPFADGQSALPVGWQWLDDGIAPRMVCRSECVTQGSQHTNHPHSS